MPGNSFASWRQKLVAVRGVFAHDETSIAIALIMIATRVAVLRNLGTHCPNNLLAEISEKVIALKYLRLVNQFGVILITD